MTFQRRDREASAITPRSTPPAPSQRHTALARLAGALGLVVVTALLFWLLTDDAFEVTEERITFRGLAHADEAEVRAHLSDIDRGPNVFRVRASDIVSELSTLTEVDAAYAKVTLPADVSVRLDERDPVFIWSDRDVAWLVDEQGMLFAPGDVSASGAGQAADVSGPADQDEGTSDAAARDDVDVPTGDTRADDPAEEAVDAEAATDSVLTAGLAARAALPVVEDGRIVEEPPTVGTFLPQADLAVMRQLLALTPELLGSDSTDLYLRVDQRDGYVLEGSPRGWRALFGHYTPTAQPPDVIARQVQCLAWLLAQHERKLVQVRLALSDDACGTFTVVDEKPRKRN